MLYLDTCTLKRPFDDQSQSRVRDETAAVLKILARVEAGMESMVWSAALSFENDQDPDLEARGAVARWEGCAAQRVTLSKIIEERAGALEAQGLRPMDAIHLASAESAGCKVLLTCDDRFLKRALNCGGSLRVMNPVDYVREVGHER
jgi:predicted nucleic acid-binding protein